MKGNFPILLSLKHRATWFALRLLPTLACLALFTQPQLATTAVHKVHVSVAQLDYNPKAKSAEIAIRVFADDLEAALSQHAKRNVKLDPATAGKDKQVSETVLAYLRRVFELKGKAGRPVRLDWVGLEYQANMFWLYVEGKLPPGSTGLEGAQLRNKVFQELFDDQVNIVNSKLGGKQIGLMFEAKDDFKPIAPPLKK